MRFVLFFTVSSLLSRGIWRPFYWHLRFWVVLTIRNKRRLWSLKPTVPARSSINPLKMVQTHQTCSQRIVDNLSFPSMLVESQISPKPLAKCLVLKFFHQSFLSPDAYDVTTWHDVINGCSKLTSQWQFVLSRSGHIALRLAWWEDPWVHLTVTKCAKTSCQHPAIYTAEQSSSSSS